MMPEIMPRYARRLRGHNDDVLIGDATSDEQH